jgi:hypothetical protein
MRNTIVFFAFFLFIYSVNAQGYADTSGSGELKQENLIRHMYDAHRGNESAIYNGAYYYPYSSAIEGMPFFRSPDWNKGNVIYDGVLYENILMRLDLVKEQLIITPSEESGVSIALFSPRVKEFSYSGLKFVRLSKSWDETFPLDEGFYLELGRGKATAYARSIKLIEENVETSGIYRKFIEKNRYYVLKNGTYYSIKNKNDLLNVLKDRKSEIQQLLDRSNVKYKSNQELSIATAVTLYNQAN